MTGFISNAFIGLKEAGSLLKGFNQLKTEAEVAQKTIELNQIIAGIQTDLFEAQSSYTAAISRIDELEKELVTGGSKKLVYREATLPIV